MNNEYTDALSDLSVIKSALNNTRTDNRLLKYLFLVFGGINVFHYFISMMIGVSGMPLNQTGKLLSLSNFLFYLATVVAVIIVTVKSKKSSNKYYVTFFAVFSGVAVLMPVIMLLVRTLSVRIFSSTVSDTLQSLSQMNVYMGIGLFTAAMIMVGISERNKVFLFLGVINIFIYLLLFASGIVLDVTASSSSIFVESGNIYYHVVISIGYLILGLYLTIKNIGVRHEKR